MVEKMGKAIPVPPEMAILRLLDQYRTPHTRDQILAAFAKHPKAVKWTVVSLDTKLKQLHADLYLNRTGPKENPVYSLTEHGRNVLGPLANEPYYRIASDITTQDVEDPEGLLGKS